jgi:DnaJ like chaperone protein
MSIWRSIGEFVSRISAGARASVGDLVEAVRTVFAGDPDLRRRVAFSVAMIALSAKMAKSDGVVSEDEIRAFHEIVEIPPGEERHVARLYNIAKGDVAGFESYAGRLADLCSGGERHCPMLEDMLDGLFHIARADGVLHEDEVRFLRRVGEIFGIDETHFQSILERHVYGGAADPYVVLGVRRGASFQDVRQKYLELVSENHPDRLVARGVPEEFIAIANSRLAAINRAYESIERSRRRA